ncbi:MAG: carbohydrate ABC transporter permease [Oscillospiraceae bacterium]
MKKKHLFTTLLLILPALMVWWPLWEMFSCAFMSKGEIMRTMGAVLSGGGYVHLPLLPQEPSLANIVELLFDSPEFFVMFWNTVIMVLPQLIGQFFIGAPAAWALSRFRFKGRGALFGLYIVLMLLPFGVTMVPSYIVLDKLHLLDSIWAIILPGIFSAFPVFIMAKGFDAVPYALLEAAEIDGASRVKSFLRIGLPLGVPGILSAMVLGFLEAWNMLEQPMIFLKNKAIWPLSLYLPYVSAQSLGSAMAACLIMLMPAVLIFLFGQKYLELGIQSAGLKE